MMRVDLAVRRWDSGSLLGGREGHVVAAFEPGTSFGRDGDVNFARLPADLADEHPLIVGLGGSVVAADGFKHRYRAVWELTGIAGDQLARLHDRTAAPPDLSALRVTAAALDDRDA